MRITKGNELVATERARIAVTQALTNLTRMRPDDQYISKNSLAKSTPYCTYYGNISGNDVSDLLDPLRVEGFVERAIIKTNNDAEVCRAYRVKQTKLPELDVLLNEPVNWSKTFAQHRDKAYR